MLSTISWDKTSYIIDGRRQFLISGEVHYFRVPPNDWRRRLELFKKSGGNCVATYVPWAYHEPVEGKFLFGDRPERDLEGFLKLCGELDLFVIARPGPYVYSEMTYAGLPEWLVKKHPDLHAIGMDGKRRMLGAMSYLHPTFLEKTRKWFAAVCPLLGKYSVSRGGPIAFAQFDNEIIGIHEWFGGWDYHPVTMGFGKPDGRYAKFLQARYGDIAALNRHYGTSFPDFAAVLPHEPAAKTIEERRRARDYHDFYLDGIAEYCATLADWMREFGLDCDTCHNCIAPANHVNFRDRKSLASTCIVGVDHYYTLGMDWPQNNPTPQYAVRMFVEMEMCRALGWPGTVYEMPGGSVADFPPVTPEDAHCCYMLHTAYGMKGLNYFIFTGGPNPPEVGGMTSAYDYQAAISATGEIRPLYHKQAEYHRFLHDNAWLAGTERVADMRVGLNWTTFLKTGFNARDGEKFSDGEAVQFLHKGFLITSLCASRSPNLLDITTGELPTDLPLFIAGTACMAEDIQRRLIRFIERGGRLFIAPVIPHLDEQFRPCTLLRDFLGATPPKMHRRLQEIAKLCIGPVSPHAAYGDVWEMPAPTGATVIATEKYSGVPIGWQKDKVIWLGVQWIHSLNEQVHMLHWLLDQLGAPAPVVECSNPNVWTSLRTDGRQSLLFAMNLFSAPMSCRIRAKRFDTGDITLAPMEVRTFTL